MPAPLQKMPVLMEMLKTLRSAAAAGGVGEIETEPAAEQMQAAGPALWRRQCFKLLVHLPWA
jgi:hypothetical protein